jgi:hypothetical protein
MVTLGLVKGTALSPLIRHVPLQIYYRGDFLWIYQINLLIKFWRVWTPAIIKKGSVMLPGKCRRLISVAHFALPTQQDNIRLGRKKSQAILLAGSHTQGIVDRLTSDVFHRHMKPA